MDTKILAALTAAGLLTACQHPFVWDAPPGGTETQFHRDNIECVATARAVAGGGLYMGSPQFVAMAGAIEADNMRAMDKECMLGKGYTLHHQ